LDFDSVRLALEALDIRVTARGREWQLHGNLAVEEAGVVTRTSADYGQNACISFSFVRESIATL
jgi:hypothetical protein